MLCDLGIDEVVAGGLESGKGAGLVLAHEAAVADHVGSKNDGQPAFHSVSHSARRLAVEGSEIYAANSALECRLLANNGPDSS